MEIPRELGHEFHSTLAEKEKRFTLDPQPKPKVDFHQTFWGKTVDQWRKTPVMLAEIDV